MNKVFLFSGWLWSLSLSTFSQNVDSLYSLYAEACSEKQIELANLIASRVYEADYTDSLYLFDNRMQAKRREAIIHNLMGDYSKHHHSDYNRSALFYLEAAGLYEQTGDSLSADIMYSDAAINHHYMGNYAKAIELMMKCYEFEKRTGDKKALSSTLNSLGIMHSQWQQSETAIRFFREALEIERTLNRPLNYANRLASLAKETLLLGDAKEALSLIREALTMDEQLEGNVRDERIAVHLNIKGDIYYEMDSLKQSESCFRRGLEYFEGRGNQRLVIASLLSLGRLYLKGNRYREASEALDRCVILADRYNIRKSKRDALRFLYQAYRQNNQPALALSSLEKYTALHDSLFLESTQQQINEFQVKYETAEKELEILRQQAEISRHKSNRTILIVSLGLSFLILLLLWRLLRLRTHRNRVLAETNATKDKFFSIISHDLKNPAIAQRNALQQLIAHSGNWDAASLSLYYEELLKSADGQVELLYNLLNWAQVQTGRMPYVPVQFDMVAELHSDIALTKDMAARKGITLHIQMPGTAIVHGDRNMLTTVVRNLLTNAVKFTGRDGRITLEIAPGKDGRYTVSVIDTGTGMAPEQVETLFKIDHQRSRTGTAGEHGSGLGLIVCKELVEKHGSTLCVESVAGQGSRFWFTL